MKVVKSLWILILTTVLLLNAACFDNENDKESAKLTINVMESDTFLRNAIKKFNSNHKNCTIIEKVYYNDQHQKYAEDLQAGLTSGTGPDIIVAAPEKINMLSKYIEDGLFSELDDFYDNDKNIQKADYFSNVMNYGIYKSKRYFVPLSYTIDALFTTQSSLKEKAVKDLEKESSWNNISAISEEYQKGNKNSYLLSSLSFSSILKNLDSNVIDLENKNAQLTSAKAKEALKLYKSICKSVMPAHELGRKASNGDISALVKSGDIVLSNYPISAPQFLWYTYPSFNSDIQPEVYAVKNSNNKYHAGVNLSAAINSKCSDKKAAYEFISQLLSKECQSKLDLYGIPVYKPAYEEKKDICIKGNKYSNGTQVGRGGGIKSEVSAKMLLNQIDKIIAELDVCKIEDNKINATIDNMVSESISNNETDEKILKSLQSAADKYFTEGIQTDGAKDAAQVTGTDEKVKLRLYYMDYEQSIKNALRESRDKYPGIDIAETVFQPDNLEEMNTKLSAELMAGEGPDIIIFRSSTFKSVNKILNSEIFCDLNELIDRDEEFDKKDYFEKIFDAGVYNSKRLFIPLEYSIPQLRTTVSTLKENNIPIDNSGFTLESLSKLSKSFAKVNSKSKNLIYCNFGFASMMEISGIKFVDFDKKKSNFRTKEFIKLLDEFKDIYSTRAAYDECIKYQSYADMTKERKIVFAYDINNQSPEQLRSFNSSYKSVVGDEMEIVPIETNGVHYARLGKLVGINSNTKNKEAAYKFIKIMLSKDFQKAYDSHGNSNINLSVPVNKKAYSEDMAFYVGNKGQEFGSTVPLVPLPKTLADKMNNIVEKAKTAHLIDNSVYDIVSETLDKYLKGMATAEQTAKAIDEKITIFLNE